MWDIPKAGATAVATVIGAALYLAIAGGMIYFATRVVSCAWNG